MIRIIFHIEIKGFLLPSLNLTTVAAKPLGTLIFCVFFKSLDEKPRNFGSEHFRTCPDFHYLDILLSLKYLRHFRLTRNIKENLDPDGG